MKRSTRSLPASGALLSIMLIAPCGAQEEPDLISERNQVGLPSADAPLAAFRGELLDLAFETASRIQVKPHIKDRSRAQEAVVAVCLELDQPRRALACIERIENWRRGACYADLALSCARHGQTGEAERYLALAAEVARETEDWRRDNVRVRIARVYAWLGETRQADEFEAGVVESEAGKVAGTRASLAEEGAFEAHASELDRLIALGSFDMTKNALESYAQLYRRFYGDPARRSQVKEKIKGSWGNLPLFIRFDLLLEMARCALDHGDRAEALDLVNEAQLLLDGAQWPLEKLIPMAASLVEVRFRCGDTEKARTDADAMRARFDAEGEQIVDIDRAETLNPLAEAYQSMGDTPSALAIYRRAVEEGVRNPNSKPRAQDLSATCCSMARSAVEPDAELRTRIRQLSGGLGPPW